MFRPSLGKLSAAAGSGEEADLEEEGLDNVFQRPRILVQRGGDGFEAYGAAFVGGGDGAEVGAVEVVEAQVVYGFEFEGGFDGGGGDEGGKRVRSGERGVRRNMRR
jgi:hypothetical protein